MEKLLLGVDVGTSACKAAVFRLDGTIAAQATVPWAVSFPAPGWAEQHPDDWWRGVCAAVRQALHSGGIGNQSVAAVAVDGQSWAAIPVDRAGRALHATPIWMDTRAAGIARELNETVEHERIFRVSGNPMEPFYSTAKMLWFRRHRPDIYRDTHLFLQSNGFITMKLTGRFTHDLSQGYGVHAFDMAALRWDDTLCGELGLDREKLPELVPSHEIVGGVTRQAAELTGLAPGTPVAAGGLDAICSTLGAGVWQDGQSQEQGGTAGGMSICAGRPLAHPKLILSPHVVPGVWVLQGGCTGGGGCLRWFRQELGAAEEAEAAASGGNAFDILCRKAAAIPAGAGGLIFLPYMAGERSPIWDAHAKGVFFGLGYGKTRAHMARAVLEGSAYALEHNLRTAYEAGVTVDSLNAIGGAANSEVWTQIKADVTGKPFRVPSSDTAATLGAAMVAGVGAGLYRDFGHAVAATVRITRTHEPDMEKHRKYMDYYRIYRDLYDKLKDTMAKLDTI